MTETSIMQHLGYTPAWLELGIVSPALLLEQWRVFQTSDDQNLEHYRHAAFLAFLEQQKHLTDRKVQAIVQLEDGDQHNLRQVRVIALLNAQKLSPAQRDWLATRAEWQNNNSVQKIVRRQITLESLHEHNLTPEVFATIQNSQDARLHDAVLGRQDLTGEHLAWLADFGQTKAIRNRAKEKQRFLGRIKGLR
jgi:hypothetical protein